MSLRACTNIVRIRRSVSEERHTSELFYSTLRHGLIAESLEAYDLEVTASCKKEFCIHDLQCQNPYFQNAHLSHMKEQKEE